VTGPLKYDPYQGYDYKPWLHYGDPGYPKRLRTKHDWIFRRLPPQHTLLHEYGRRIWYYRPYKPQSGSWNVKRHVRTKESFVVPPKGVQLCRRCQHIHCLDCGCYRPWKKCKQGRSVWEKREVHRRFRHLCRDAIAQELAGNDAVSHAFYVSGDWLD